MKIHLKTRISLLLLTAKVKASTEEEARDKTRSAFFDRNISLINSTFRIEVYKQEEGLFICDVLNYYFVEQLSFVDRIRNLLRIVDAATFNIGITPIVVEIE